MKMFSMPWTQIRSIRVTNLLMMAGFLVAILAYLPIGYSGSSPSNGPGGYSFIQILWWSIPASEEIVRTLTYLAAVIGPMAVGIALLGLTRTVHQISTTKKVFGRYGLIILVVGACSLFLSGIFSVFHVYSTYTVFDTFAIIAEIAGIAIFASGVLMATMNASMVGPSDKWIGTRLVGIGALFLIIFTGAVIIENFYPISSPQVWVYLNALGITGIPLVLIGIVWVENCILIWLKQREAILRIAMVFSLSILLTGATYLFLLNGPSIGVQVGGQYEWGVMSTFLTYMFTLGILSVLGTTILMGVRVGRILRKKYASESV
jgi:hypothetical protein